MKPPSTIPTTSGNVAHPDMDIFPYNPRPFQKDIVEFMHTALSSGKACVVESGTGTGKTVCSLCAAVSVAKSSGKKIIYLTRTKSQMKQAILELRRISKKIDVFGLPVQGRSPSTCLMMNSLDEMKYGTPDELSKLCSKLKSDKEKGCPYYNGLIKNKDSLEELMNGMPDSEELVERCLSLGICPYEAIKSLIPNADMIVAPYVFMVHPSIRRHLLDWMNISLQDTIIIVDEAHNLPDYLRESFTSEYSLKSLENVVKEATVFGDMEVAPGISVIDVSSAMKSAFGEAAVEYLGDVDGLIPFGFLQEHLMGELHVSSITLASICKNLIELGEIIKEKKKESRKLPRSYIGNLGLFIDFWMRCDDSIYVKLIVGGENPKFEAYCMDPYIPAEPFRTCGGSIHMSGTLEPLSEYVAEMGFSQYVSNSFPSPFDGDNLVTVYAEDVTTRHRDLQVDPSNIDRIANHIVEILEKTDRNVAVFFPSYDMMERFISFGLEERIEGSIFHERRDMGQYELMETVDAFKTSSSGILFAVTGGRISEGVDFPGYEMEVALIVGLPYSRPSSKSEALIRYCDYRYGNGWEHVVKTPMVRKMRQARGRLIRSETDRGFAAVLDARAVQIPGFGAIPSSNIIKNLEYFFNS